jgi:hypothetical protein
MENRDLLRAFLQRRQAVRDWKPLGSLPVQDNLGLHDITIHLALTILPKYIEPLSRMHMPYAWDLYQLWVAAKVYYIASRQGRDAAILWRLSFDAR